MFFLNINNLWNRLQLNSYHLNLVAKSFEIDNWLHHRDSLVQAKTIYTKISRELHSLVKNVFFLRESTVRGRFNLKTF